MLETKGLPFRVDHANEEGYQPKEDIEQEDWLFITALVCERNPEIVESSRGEGKRRRKAWPGTPARMIIGHRE
jgi:hypothetical protein